MTLGISGSDGSNVIEGPGSGTVFIGDTGSSTEPTEVTETDLTEIQLPEILTSEPKSSTVGGAGDDEPEEIDEDTGVSTSLLPPAGKSGGAISAGGSGAESGAIPENAITEPGDCTRPDLGSQSERYESNGNPGVINTKSASRDRGGWSYGSYQIATKVGTFKSWMSFLAKEENGYTDFYNSLNNVGGNTDMQPEVMLHLEINGKNLQRTKLLQQGLNKHNMTLFKELIMTQQFVQLQKTLELMFVMVHIVMDCKIQSGVQQFSLGRCKKDIQRSTHKH